MVEQLVKGRDAGAPGDEGQLLAVAEFLGHVAEESAVAEILVLPDGTRNEQFVALFQLEEVLAQLAPLGEALGREVDLDDEPDHPRFVDSADGSVGPLDMVSFGVLSVQINVLSCWSKEITKSCIWISLKKNWGKCVVFYISSRCKGKWSLPRGRPSSQLMLGKSRVIFIVSCEIFLMDDTVVARKVSLSFRKTRFLDLFRRNLKYATTSTKSVTKQMLQ